MKRGEIWTLQDGGYASKARPVVIVQGQLGNRFDSVILCLFTTYDSCDISTRVRIEPEPSNGLRATSFVMTDKIVTVGHPITCLCQVKPVELAVSERSTDAAGYSSFQSD